jgi:hypothetical protein
METTLRELVYKHSLIDIYNALISISNDLQRDIDCFRGQSKLFFSAHNPSRLPKPIQPPPADILEILETGTETEAPAPVPVPPARTDKDKKEAHKKAIRAKYDENAAKGIAPTSLLTKEALTNWINDGKTYWTIAEETGASDADVSTMAKLHGLQSTLSKIIAGKKQMK